MGPCKGLAETVTKQNEGSTWRVKNERTSGWNIFWGVCVVLLNVHQPSFHSVVVFFLKQVQKPSFEHKASTICLYLLYKGRFEETFTCDCNAYVCSIHHFTLYPAQANLECVFSECSINQPKTNDWEAQRGIYIWHLLTLWDIFRIQDKGFQFEQGRLYILQRIYSSFLLIFSVLFPPTLAPFPNFSVPLLLYILYIYIRLLFPSDLLWNNPLTF